MEPLVGQSIAKAGFRCGPTCDIMSFLAFWMSNSMNMLQPCIRGFCIPIDSELGVGGQSVTETKESPWSQLGLFQKLSSWVGGLQALCCPMGGGCFVDDMSEGWGISLTNPVQGVGGLSCSGGQGVFDL